jgi:hypothetical protein
METIEVPPSLGMDTDGDILVCPHIFLKIIFGCESHAHVPINQNEKAIPGLLCYGC